jgi:hypothetical protein|uniref:Uncharacterized protein n=1 Tax=Candidatus Methanogaster sp. ANME-2c ERB4 TaxID=2759911 RepID=A0A7G9YNP7_9EURY|nr:hypothetical protein AIHMFPNM_00034 [Methanosarcinales archaeon ANME-2c ERB4]
MATRLEELEERLAALESETGGYAPYGEEYAQYGEEYSPYGEEYAPYEEEYTAYEEEMVVGALEEELEVEGMSEAEIGSFSDTAEALETGQLQWDELTSVEQMGFWNFVKKAARVVKRVARKVRPIWRAAKPILTKRWPWMRYIPFEEEMSVAPRKMLVPSKPIRPIPIPRCNCPRGYRTVRVTGYRCVRAWPPWPVRPPMPKPPVLRPIPMPPTPWK